MIQPIVRLFIDQRWLTSFTIHCLGQYQYRGGPWRGINTFVGTLAAECPSTSHNKKQWRGKSTMKVADWVVVQRGITAHVGYVSPIDDKWCDVAIIDMQAFTFSKPTPMEVIRVQCDKFAPLGKTHWHAKLDE